MHLYYKTSSLLIASLATLFAINPARAQFASAILPLPAASTTGYASGISHGEIAGGTTPTTGHALLWNGTTNAVIDLDPGKFGSTLTGIDGHVEVGSYGAYRVYVSGGGSGRGGGYHPPHWVYYYHAAIWKGSGKSLVDLGPTTGSMSYATAISGNKQVGYLGGTIDTQACMWTGTAASFFDLDPPNCPQSMATCAGSIHEGGYMYSSTGAEHAVLWTGANNVPVDLHPTAYPSLSSYMTCLDDSKNQQGGYLRGLDASGINVVNTAFLWNGTPSGTVLAPAGSTASAVLAIRGGYQVGIAVIGGVTHAILWHGTAASAIDLGPGQANAIDGNGDIAGTQSGVPVVWRNALTPHITITQTPLPNAVGWCIAPVQLAVQSPFTTGTPSMSYHWGSGVTTTVGGSTTTITLTAQGMSYLSLTATNGTTTPQAVFATVNVDTIAPVTKLAYSSGVVTLTATDASSGVAATYYTLDGGPSTLYTAPFAISNTGHTVTYWSVDFAGNVEAVHSVTLAPAPPTLTSITLPAALDTGADTSITLTGVGFISTSVALWNGSPIVTTYVNATTLDAVIPGSDLTAPTSATISVQNSAPGTGTSAALSFPVYQEAIATGSADDGGLTMTSVNSHSGFTFSGETLNIGTLATTEYRDSTGTAITAYVFESAVGTGATFTATGTYSSGTLTAWILQLN